jgi:hypothetical protein
MKSRIKIAVQRSNYVIYCINSATEKNKPEEKMRSSIVRRLVPAFNMDAFDQVQGILEQCPVMIIQTGEVCPA